MQDRVSDKGGKEELLSPPGVLIEVPDEDGKKVQLSLSRDIWLNILLLLDIKDCLTIIHLTKFTYKEFNADKNLWQRLIQKYLTHTLSLSRQIAPKEYFMHSYTTTIPEEDKAALVALYYKSGRGKKGKLYRMEMEMSAVIAFRFQQMIRDNNEVQLRNFLADPKAELFISAPKIGAPLGRLGAYTRETIINIIIRSFDNCFMYANLLAATTSEIYSQIVEKFGAKKIIFKFAKPIMFGNRSVQSGETLNALLSRSTMLDLVLDHRNFALCQYMLDQGRDPTLENLFKAIKMRVPIDLFRNMMKKLTDRFCLTDRFLYCSLLTASEIEGLHGGELFKFIIETGDDFEYSWRNVNYTNLGRLHYSTALDFFVGSDYLNCLIILIENKKINVTNLMSLAAYHDAKLIFAWCVKNCHDETYKNTIGKYSFFDFVRQLPKNRNYEAALDWLFINSNINACDASGTVLEHAVTHLKDCELFIILLSGGALVTERAIELANYPTVKLLLQHEYDLSQKIKQLENKLVQAESTYKTPIVMFPAASVPPSTQPKAEPDEQRILRQSR